MVLGYNFFFQATGRLMIKEREERRCFRQKGIYAVCPHLLPQSWPVGRWSEPTQTDKNE